LQINDILGCKGIVRVDFILVGEEPYFLDDKYCTRYGPAESLIPMQAATANIKLEELYSLSD